MKEMLIETEVTYTLELGGRFYIVEHVPARVCPETGEQFFAPETVERIQALIKGDRKPDRVVETPSTSTCDPSHRPRVTSHACEARLSCCWRKAQNAEGDRGGVPGHGMVFH